MSRTGAVVLGGFLLALFLGIVALMVWQEARRRPRKAERVYGVEEAIRFISGRLAPDVRQRLSGGGVRRVIEWEVFYLQGLAQKSRRNPVEAVAGGSEGSIDYITERIRNVNGVTYDRADVAEVLRLEADYLVSIGAVGEAVDPQEATSPDDSVEGRDKA